LRFEIEFRENDIDKIIQSLNSKVGKKVSVRDFTLQLAKKNVMSTDYLFLTLKKLVALGIIESGEGEFTVKSEIGEEIANEIKEDLRNRMERTRKIFITPLEVGKFYQCPRRFWLEKIVLSRQFKERRGKVWDGEVVHLAVTLLIRSFNRGEENLEEIIEKASKEALSKYEGKTQLTLENVESFLKEFYDLIKNENFLYLIPEKEFMSIKHGIVGSPDVIGVKEDEIVPMDIKLGKLNDRRGVKKEHVLQTVGEGIVAEDYFRIPVNSVYIIYFQSNSLVKIKMTDKVRGEFFGYKKMMMKTFTSDRIPPKSRLPNYKNRVCKGCHVRPACENIERMRRLGMKHRMNF